jgi:surface polysaccharide O-acyltransferase-like enzyme
LEDKTINRIYYLDGLRILSIFFVIVLHQCAVFTVNEKLDFDFKTAAYTLFSISHIGVPLFLMISGALLLSPARIQGVKIFYRKRIPRILLTLVFWSVVYYLIRFHNSASMADFLNRFMKDDIIGHLWFLYMIIGVYLATPFLQTFSPKKEYVEMFLILWVLFSVINPFIGTLFNVSLKSTGLIFTTYIGYFLLGYYLHSIPVEEKLNNILFVSSIIILIIIVMSGTVCTWLEQTKQNDIFWGYNRPTILLASILVFLFFKKNGFKLFSRKIMNNISASVFGIYLIHIMVRNQLSANFKWLINPSSAAETILLILLGSLLTFIISLFLILFIKRIPYFKKVVT